MFKTSLIRRDPIRIDANTLFTARPILRKMPVIQGLLLIALSAPVWAQSSPEPTVDALIDHASYFSKQGERAEAECYMRLAQRRQPANPFLKDRYSKWPIDTPRDHILRLAELLGGAIHAGRPRNLFDPVNPVMQALVDKKLPEATESALRAVGAFKVTFGENDSNYLTLLEIAGDLHAIAGHYDKAIAVFSQARQIREAVGPPIVTNPNNLSAYQARTGLQRIMSKLADAYWISGQDDTAATLRKDVMTREGDRVRLRDVELNDSVPKRGPSAVSPEHPPCVAGFNARIR